MHKDIHTQKCKAGATPTTTILIWTVTDIPVTDNSQKKPVHTTLYLVWDVKK